MAKFDAIGTVVLGSLEKPPKRRILVVEGEESLLLTLSLFLEESGFAVVMAGTVEHAISKLGREKFDALLLDLSLGNRSGEEIINFLGISLSPCPEKVIAMSCVPIAIEDLRPHGVVTGVLEKPFRFEDLLKELEAFP